MLYYKVAFNINKWFYDIYVSENKKYADTGEKNRKRKQMLIFK